MKSEPAAEKDVVFTPAPALNAELSKPGRAMSDPQPPVNDVLIVVIEGTRDERDITHIERINIIDPLNAAHIPGLGVHHPYRDRTSD